ncbi:hypothetical protein HXX02_17210, partial [Microbulbifer elongatus]
ADADADSDSDLDNAISYVAFRLEDGRIIKVEGFEGEFAEIKDPSYPETLYECIEEEYGSPVDTDGLLDPYIIKAGNNHYDPDGNQVTTAGWPVNMSGNVGGPGVADTIDVADLCDEQEMQSLAGENSDMTMALDDTLDSELEGTNHAPDSMDLEALEALIESKLEHILEYTLELLYGDKGDDCCCPESQDSTQSEPPPTLEDLLSDYIAEGHTSGDGMSELLGDAISEHFSAVMAPEILPADIDDPAQDLWQQGGMYEV